jgi:hypothetical protein
VWHLQGRSGEIVAIKVSNDVEQKNVGQKTQGNPAAGPAGDVIGDNGWGGQFFSVKTDQLETAGTPKNHAII